MSEFPTPEMQLTHLLAALRQDRVELALLLLAEAEPLDELLADRFRRLAPAAPVCAGTGREDTYAAMAARSSAVRRAMAIFISCAASPLRVPCWMSHICRVM